MDGRPKQQNNVLKCDRPSCNNCDVISPTGCAPLSVCVCSGDEEDDEEDDLDGPTGKRAAEDDDDDEEVRKS